DVTVINVAVAWSAAGARRVGRADPAFAGFTPSDTLIADLARRCFGRRPVYFAVTLSMPSAIAGISDRLEPEGLVWRVPAPGHERPDHLTALERFVTDRLPRAGLADPRQRIEPGVAMLAMNYAAAALQLASARLARHDGGGA